MIRAVVFDFDGTLVDSNRIKDAVLDRMAAEMPSAAQSIVTGRARGDNRYVLFADVARRLYPDASASEQASAARTLAARYTRDCATGIRAANERRGARAALAALRRRGMPLWINTGTPQRDIGALLRARGLAGFFAGALGTPASKVENLRHVMTATRARPQEIVLVGDSGDDLHAAQETGVHFIAIDAEKRIADRVRHAVPDLRRLVALIDRLDGNRPRRDGQGSCI